MKLFEFDIAWDQPVTEVFDQDDIKTVGTQRVETDSVRVVAPDAELARLALQRAFSNCRMRLHRERELDLHIFVEQRMQTIRSTRATRVVGPLEPNELGRLMESRATPDVRKIRNDGPPLHARRGIPDAMNRCSVDAAFADPSPERMVAHDVVDAIEQGGALHAHFQRLKRDL